MISLTALVIAGLSVLFFILAQSRALALAGGDLARLHSRPTYHGAYALLWVALIGLVALVAISASWSVMIDRVLMGQIAAGLTDKASIEGSLILNDAKSIAAGNAPSTLDPLRQQTADRFGSMNGLRVWGSVALGVGSALAAGYFALRKIGVDFRARNRTERIVEFILWGCAAVAVLTTVGILLSLIFETLVFLSNIGWRIDKFLFGNTWSPLSGVQDGVIDVEKIGAIPLFTGTLLITGIAMLVAVPIGLFAAIYLSEFANARFRSIAKPVLEILAGIPTVVYGFFAAITVAPFIRSAGETLGLSVASESALAAGLVMGIMIIPFISSLSDDVINAVPQSLRDGSYGLGATKAETVRQVILPAALPGIVSAILLGVSRAVGETMIVVMAAGQGANLSLNPFAAVTTVTVQIVMLITGDTEASVAAGPAFTLGFTLFCITLLLNIIALRIVRRYRETYD